MHQQLCMLAAVRAEYARGSKDCARERYAEALGAQSMKSQVTLDTQVDRIIVRGDVGIVVGAIRWTEGDRSGVEWFDMVAHRDGTGWRAVAEHVSDTRDGRAKATAAPTDDP